MATGSQKAPQSFPDALGAIVVDISQAQLAPDADLKFLMQLEMVVIGRLKSGEGPQQGGPQPMGAQPVGPAGAGEPAGAPAPGGPPMGPPPGSPPPPQGGPQPHANIPPMDPEEMRRVIADTTGS